MGRNPVLPGGLLLLLLLTTACSGPAHEETAAPKARPSNGRSAGPEAEGSPGKPELSLPRGAQILVPVTEGTGPADLPAFTPPTDVYSVYATCSGKGTMSIVHRDDAEGGPSKIGCNGPLTIGRVHTDGGLRRRDLVRLSCQARGDLCQGTDRKPTRGVGGRVRRVLSRWAV
ncbi:hypothetical protein GCM10009601_13900 [Streptomyces thermospinosisporus]|uniref:Lipoprotein n=1 Tax=Streptomyces thermospinosisporus TaxID=161482 RepID=A0ABP4JGG2_9ACTN